MVAYQVSVFAENKPGRLAAVTQVLAREKINIRATTIATADTFGVIHLIVDDPQRAEQALTKAGMTASLREVLAVVIEDRPGGLDRLTQLLAKADVNINNAYGFVLESRKRAVFVLDVNQAEKARNLLIEKGFPLLDTEALAQVEPFHYMKY